MSNSLFFEKLLPVLNSINFINTSIISDRNLFLNKNYFSMILKLFPMPKTVIMYINDEFLGSGYELITEEEALRRMEEFPQLVFKPAASSGHGANVALVERKHYKQTMQKYAELPFGCATLFRKF